jgi:hypothetical protein
MCCRLGNILVLNQMECLHFLPLCITAETANNRRTSGLPKSCGIAISTAPRDTAQSTLRPATTTRNPLLIFWKGGHIYTHSTRRVVAVRPTTGSRPRCQIQVSRSPKGEVLNPLRVPPWSPRRRKRARRTATARRLHLRLRRPSRRPQRRSHRRSPSSAVSGKVRLCPCLTFWFNSSSKRCRFELVSSGDQLNGMFRTCLQLLRCRDRTQYPEAPTCICHFHSHLLAFAPSTLSNCLESLSESSLRTYNFAWPHYSAIH